jgi:hypothetical protein
MYRKGRSRRRNINCTFTIAQQVPAVPFILFNVNLYLEIKCKIRKIKKKKEKRKNYLLFLI